MRVLMISKALVTGVYQRKAEELAALPDLTLRVVVPPSWRENELDERHLERHFTQGYELVEHPIRLNGRHHVHYYPGIERHFEEFQPDIVHVDEEPYNLVTFQAMRIAAKFGTATCFFAWQNLLRKYPPPFRWIEQYNYRVADHAIAGNRDAALMLRKKGYRGPLSIIPQFGVDPEIYAPAPADTVDPHNFVVGFVGRLVAEKGADLLLRAAADLPEGVRVLIVGDGPERRSLARLAAELGISERVEFVGSVPGQRVPELLRGMNVLVLPSRTRSNWKEQFGRILVEAMACGVPVIGSDSGEIPNVIGDAGLVFPEDNADVLRDHLEGLRRDPHRCHELARAGRQRVLDRFTQQQIARASWKVYRSMLDRRERSGKSGS